MLTFIDNLNKTSMKQFLLYNLFLLCSLSLLSQPHLGLRFSTDLNYFPRFEERDFISGWFSTGKFGVFLRNDQPKSGFEVGINVNYKDFDDSGFPNLPGVMQNFKKDQNSGFTSIEMDFKVGPKFYGVYPKIGYVMGYRFNVGGFQVTENQEINPFYLSLPFGASFNLPTEFGTVGAGAYYLVGVTNVLKSPDSQNTGGLYNGGRMRAINIEIVVTYGMRR